jgi:hypothetical protein
MEPQNSQTRYRRRDINTALHDDTGSRFVDIFFALETRYFGLHSLTHSLTYLSSHGRKRVWRYNH